MSLTSVLPMALGAFLVAIGVLSGAMADRIRQFRQVECPTPEPTARAPRAGRAKASAAAPAAPPVMPAQDADLANEVASVLVSLGHGKRAAAEAVASCGPAERASLESWTRAALRSCGKAVS